MRAYFELSEDGTGILPVEALNDYLAGSAEAVAFITQSNSGNMDNRLIINSTNIE